ncbi:MAG: hypothetical protein ABIX01_17065 [Chitinophagaceae bacterium]
MPLQNRVTPFGEIVSIPQRGLYTGNRGIIHNEQQQIVRPFTLKAWITCTLKYKNFQRLVMTGRKWTELFFLDEATAFAAGHRPCAFCRNKDFKQFKSHWLEANKPFFSWPDKQMKTIDLLLHKERMAKQKEKRFESAALSTLPAGTMVALNNDTKIACLWYQNKLFKWCIEGYESPVEPKIETEVFVITPASIVRTFTQGYEPNVHPSADIGFEKMGY